MRKIRYLSATILPQESSRFTLDMDQRMEKLLYRYGVKTSWISMKTQDVVSVQNQYQPPSLTLITWFACHLSQMSLRNQFHSQFHWITSKTPKTTITSGTIHGQLSVSWYLIEDLTLVVLLSYSKVETSGPSRTNPLTIETILSVCSRTLPRYLPRSSTQRRSFVNHHLPTYLGNPLSKSRWTISNILMITTSSTTTDHHICSISVPEKDQSLAAQEWSPSDLTSETLETLLASSMRLLCLVNTYQPQRLNATHQPAIRLVSFPCQCL